MKKIDIVGLYLSKDVEVSSLIISYQSPLDSFNFEKTLKISLSLIRPLSQSKQRNNKTKTLFVQMAFGLAHSTQNVSLNRPCFFFN
jgi:hypothetical protein